jgi:hypothetical protein
MLTGASPSVDLSVVVPVYNAEETIAALVQQLLDVYRPRGLIQIVLVNDGSRDRSHDICVGMAEKFPDAITYLRLAKNFGEHNAVMAGLRHAQGAYVVVMDDDFQHQPVPKTSTSSTPTSPGGSMAWAAGWGAGSTAGSRTSCWISPRTCTCRASSV